jgi:hypothetical protein
MPRRDLRLLLVLAAVALLWAATQSAIGYEGGWTFLAPAMLVALPLLAGRYLGEERIVRMASQFAARRLVRGPRVQGRRRARESLFCRGGALIARSLAERPPPLRLSA